MNLLKRSSLCLFLYLTVFPVWAQITDPTDPLRPALPDSVQTSKIDTTAIDISDQDDDKTDPTEPDTAIYRFRFTADGTANSGNVNRILLQVTGAIDYALSRRFKLSTNPSYIYGRQNGLLNEREWFTDLRSTYNYEKQFYYLAFGSVEQSNLRKIHLRFTAAAGVGYKLINKPLYYLSVTDVLLQEYTNFEEAKDINVLRNSARAFGEYYMGKDKRWSVSHTVFYQPALNQKGNIRWNASLSLQVRVTAAINLRTSLFNSYESIVSPGRKNNDLRWTMGFVYEKR